HFFARPVGEIGGDYGTEVGGNQQLLQLPEQRVVDRTIGLQHGAQTSRQVFLRPLESLAEALADGGKELHGGSDGSTRRVGPGGRRLGGEVRQAGCPWTALPAAGGWAPAARPPGSARAKLPWTAEELKRRASVVPRPSPVRT